jgi:hypothetical protein
MGSSARRTSSFLYPVLVALALPRAAAAYEAISVTDGGTIKGKVVYQGTVPTKKIIPTKDKEVCGDIREEPEIAVGADKGVKDSVVYLKGIQKGKALEKPVKKPEIVNKGCVFVPHVQAFPVGTVVIVNSDPVMHNTHGFHGKATAFNVALPVKGQRIEKPLNKPGMVRVECDAHGWMLAWIYAADNPYYAVTQKDGTFTIADVPPGSYTLVAWHEFTGEMEVPVTVKAKDAAQLSIELKKK